MAWKYNQATGQLTRPDGAKAGFGFAGQGQGLNNPAMESVVNTGPLPKGEYTMTQWMEAHPSLGLCVIQLEPASTNQMFGRSAFFIHGTSNLTTRGLNVFLRSSEGCICYGDCTSRRGIWNSGDRILKVE